MVKVIVVDPLGEVVDLQVAIDALELEETSPMKAVMIHMTNKIYSKSIQQVNIKKQNSLLMASSRKSQIEEAVGKLNNPHSPCETEL